MNLERLKTLVGRGAWAKPPQDLGHVPALPVQWEPGEGFISKWQDPVQRGWSGSTHGELQEGKLGRTVT